MTPEIIFKEDKNSRLSYHLDHLWSVRAAYSSLGLGADLVECAGILDLATMDTRVPQGNGVLKKPYISWKGSHTILKSSFLKLLCKSWNLLLRSIIVSPRKAKDRWKSCGLDESLYTLRHQRYYVIGKKRVVCFGCKKKWTQNKWWLYTKRILHPYLCFNNIRTSCNIRTPNDKRPIHLKLNIRTFCTCCVTWM